jgi:diguanylate cyclase (GGDEF)-like protein
VERSLYIFSDCQPYLTLSIGVAQANFNHETREQMLERADKALYEAKEAGRNCERH